MKILAQKFRKLRHISELRHWPEIRSMQFSLRNPYVTRKDIIASSQKRLMCEVVKDSSSDGIVRGPNNAFQLSFYHPEKGVFKFGLITEGELTDTNRARLLAFFTRLGEKPN